LLLVNCGFCWLRWGVPIQHKRNGKRGAGQMLGGFPLTLPSPGGRGDVREQTQCVERPLTFAGGGGTCRKQRKQVRDGRSAPSCQRVKSLYSMPDVTFWRAAN
jgi:hypothetical protein